MVTNRDECICIKHPASNILVERIWCNQSGGSSIGSLGAGVAVENIHYKDVYTNGGNQAFMIKSNGGSGYCRNVMLENFQTRGAAYGLNVMQYWDRMTPAEGNGVQLTNITFKVCRRSC
jgi:rhamnogalacturonan hydrolase